MPVKARAGGQGRVRGGRVGAQQGTGGTPGSPTPDPSLAVSIGTNIALGVGSWTSPGSLSAQTVQFFDRLVTMPSAARQNVYATLIDALVSAGVWAKLDALFLYASADSATSLTNLVQEPHRGFLDVSTGAPTFTVDRGWSANGAAGFTSVNTNFNPSTAGGNYTQNDAMLCAWQAGVTQENAALITNTLNDSKSEIFPRWSDGKTYWAINGNGTEIASTAPANGSGFWLAQRTGTSACEIHNNDILIGTSSNASAALDNSFIVVNPVANTAACLGIGGSLSADQQTAFYNAVHAYMISVGAA
jgi:hypothetical protein